jgi:DNA replication protein DnaC
MTNHPNTSNTAAQLRQRAQALQLNGLLAHWAQIADQAWLVQLIEWEEHERARRSMERRLRTAKIGQFKPLADFDWSWPTRCDRQAVQEMMALEFMAEAANVILFGPNGIGKSTIARNVAYQALISGNTVHFASVSAVLGNLAAIDSASALQRKLRHYASFDLLCLDEVGYLSYSNRHADLLFELTNRRYEKKSTIITTNKPFAQWHEVFPNAACVVSLIDRLTHKAEVLALEGKSYRLKEAQERAQQREQRRKRTKDHK